MARAKGIKPMAQNKKAFHDYFVEERLECGMDTLAVAGRMRFIEKSSERT